MVRLDGPCPVVRLPAVRLARSPHDTTASRPLGGDNLSGGPGVTFDTVDQRRSRTGVTLALAASALLLAARPAASAAASPAAPAPTPPGPVAAPALPRVISTATAPLAHPWIARLLTVGGQQVRVAGVLWRPGAAPRGGRVISSSPAPAGASTPLLRRARLGSGTYRVSVPRPGTYRVTLVVPRASRSVTPGRVTAEGQPAVSGLTASPRTATIASFSALVTDGALDLRVVGGNVGVSALQVVQQSAAPAGGLGVPAAPLVSALPSTGLLPTRAPVAPAWPSGAWPGGTNDRDAVKAFEVMRRRALDVISTSDQRLHWNDIATDFYGVDRYAGLPGRLSIAVPMLPDDRSSSFADVIAGKHDAEFRSLAAGLVARGRGDSILRLGWEFTGDWQPWAAFDAVAFKAAFRREVAVIRAAAPDILIDWNGNYGPSHVPHTLNELWPGDDVVDIVGVDAYDRVYFHVGDERSWQEYVNRPDGGLLAWYDFARQHGKKLSVPEWALYADNPSGSDNPFYVQKMYSFFAAHASTIAYECYFNERATYIRSSLIGPVQNPRSAAAYGQLF